MAGRSSKLRIHPNFTFHQEMNKDILGSPIDVTFYITNGIVEFAQNGHTVLIEDEFLDSFFKEVLRMRENLNKKQ